MSASMVVESTLSTLDISLFILSLAISVLIGLYFANKNNTLEEYTLGGRDQRIIPVALSMMTSFISGLTLIGSPAEFYHHGVTFAMTEIATPLSAPISAFILLPVFHRLRSVSVFGYLEQRYNRSIRLLTSLAFMLQMTLYNAVVLYVPSLSLQSVLGISDTISIGAVGLSCIVYCTFGGIKAVIWTDFFQAGLMYLALISICIGGTIQAGGFSRLIELSEEGGRLSLEHFYDFNLTTRHTIFITITGSVIINVFMNGANQIQVQRTLSLPSLRASQWSLIISALFTMAIMMIASYIGLIMYATYATCDPFNDHKIVKRDALVIYYISTQLKSWPGIRGIFVAGIFAATLSTLSSFQNSMATLVLEDFLRPSLGKRLNNKLSLYLGKAIALLFGIVCIGLTFIVGRVSGLLQIAYTLFGALGSPIIAAFLMGMMTRFTNSIGMFAGILAGYALGIYIQLYQTFYKPPLEPTLALSTSGCLNSTNTLVSPHYSSTIEDGAQEFTDMSYLWLPVISLVLSVIVATIVSLLSGGLKQQVEDKYLIGLLHIKQSYELDYSHRKEDLVDEVKSYVSSKA